MFKVTMVHGMVGFVEMGENHRGFRTSVSTFGWIIWVFEIFCVNNKNSGVDGFFRMKRILLRYKGIYLG